MRRACSRELHVYTMSLCIVQTTNNGILFDSQDPYKHFDSKHLGFPPQKQLIVPPPVKTCIEYAPLLQENVFLSIIKNALLSKKSIYADSSITGFGVEPQRGFQDRASPVPPLQILLKKIFKLALHSLHVYAIFTKNFDVHTHQYLC